MNKPLIPSTDADFANFVSNLGAKLAPMVTTFGLTAADATAVTTDATSMQAAVIDQLSKFAAAKGSTQAKAVLRQGVEKRTRALIARLKSHPAYTSTLGEQLGIVAPTEGAGTIKPLTTASRNSQPRMTGLLSADGKVGIRFVKNGYSGIIIYGRRGDEKELTILAKQLRSPFMDERANLVAGEPETREYRAIYLDGDQPAGKPSDVLVVTVPGELESGSNAQLATLAKAA